MASAFVRFKLRKEDFLSLTPKEYMTILSKWNDEKMLEIKSNWERTRLQIYYSMKFKNPVTYKSFCEQFLPLEWDEKEEPFEITQELVDYVFKEPEGNILTTPIKDLSQL